MSHKEDPPVPLEYPDIDFNFIENRKVTEHIILGVKEDCFDSLLDELEIQFKHVADKLRLLVGHAEFELALQQ